MRLTRVTITGADDKTPTAELDALSTEFPFVEWGLLLSPKRAGSARYPSPEATFRLLEAAGTALHLCGEAAESALNGRHPYGRPGLRFQVNGFTKWVDAHGPLTPFAEWVTEVHQKGAEVILQVQHARALSVARLLADIHPNISALWDESGGRGFAAGPWPDPPPGLRLGYAGGINPDTIRAAIECIREKRNEEETWLDMESGVRTEDELDLDKVRAVLEQASPWVQRSPRALGSPGALHRALAMTTIEQMQAALTERELSMNVWITEEWVVWLYCADDPSLGTVTVAGDSLTEAFMRALAEWDGKNIPRQRTRIDGEPR